MTDNLEVVIAIDFGTSRTGYAYGFFNDLEERPYGDTDWPGQKTPYPKAPTLLLYSSDKTLEGLGWGYLTKRRLAELQNEHQQRLFHFFEKFKMSLNEKDYVGDYGPTIESKGQLFLVIDLIADYLRIIKDRALTTVMNATGNTIELDEIRWCLTVPAIWEDIDKQLMREAAYRAGIVDHPEDEHLLLVLEPETAAIYCQRHNQPQIDIGTQFMVIDCGGGTIDITVYRVYQNGILREIATGTGGPFGSMYLDDNFQKYLMERLKKEIVADYKISYPVDFVEMMDDWEIAKCDFDPDDAREITYIRISKQFDKIINQYDGYLHRLAQEQDGDEDHIQIHRRDMVNKIFNPTLDEIIQIIKNQFDELGHSPIDYIFLVGGFATSKLLQQRIREEFSNKVTDIIIPPSPGFAVLQGAVWYGLRPEILRARKSRKTYGFRTYMNFEEGLDPEAKKVFLKAYNDYRCADRFAVIVRSGDSIEIDQVKKSTHIPYSLDQVTMKLEFFSTSKANPRFVDEAEVQKVGELEINLPSKSMGIDRKIVLEFHFGLTEIQVKASNGETSDEYLTRLRFSTYY